MTHSPHCALLVRNGACSCQPVTIEVRAGSGVLLYCLACERTVANLVRTTIPQLILAEQQHREQAHPQQYDLSGLHDAVGEDDE